MHKGNYLLKTIDVLLLPEEILNRNFNDKLVVMIDVLRASSTIVTALSRGCEGFIPIFSPGEARKKAKNIKSNHILLCGERKGKKIFGFDLGNSPLEFKEEIVKYKKIVFTTTNGVKVLEMASYASEIIICSFLNINAVCDYCLRFKGDIFIICAGSEGQFSLEDTVCAGMLMNCVSRESHEIISESDAVKASQILYKHYGKDLLGMLKKSQHGKYLRSIGLEKDLQFCASINLFNIVPIYKNGAIIAFAK